MKICVTGTQCVGKTTFIQDFIKQWPMYKIADNSYRDVVKKNPKVKLNKEGSLEGQRLILDSLCDQATSYTKTDNVIFDRCVYDNLAYTMWLNAKDKGNINDLFVEKTIQLVKETSKLYDIIFFVPILEQYPVDIVEDVEGQRDVDPVFRAEIDAILKAIFKTYYEQKSAFFDMKDCPAVIELFGSREERVQMAKMYLGEDGGVNSIPLIQ